MSELRSRAKAFPQGRLCLVEDRRSALLLELIEEYGESGTVDPASHADLSHCVEFAETQASKSAPEAGSYFGNAAALLSEENPSPESRPGTYALVLASSRTARVRVGRLGTMTVRPGFYVYVGSALGPGGIKERVGRHCSRARRRHWHVDYLRSATRLDDVWFTHDPGRREHEWAAVLEKRMGGVAPLRGFGASDCGCRSHLFYFPERPSGTAFVRCLRGRARRHEAVWVETRTQE